jgi:hypothetical protein
MGLSERVLKVLRKGCSSVYSVLLHRGGSGGGVIESIPSERWLAAMQILHRDGYMAYMRVVIDPSSRAGYGGYPEFRIIFLPGKHDGLHEPTEDPSRSIPVWEDNDFRGIFPCCDSGAFIINTSWNDLVNLRDALNRAIRSGKKKRGKCKF